jgi:hypothetical protein
MLVYSTYLSIAMAVIESVDTKTETEFTSANVRHSHVLSPSGQKLKQYRTLQYRGLKFWIAYVGPYHRSQAAMQKQDSWAP